MKPAAVVLLLALLPLQIGRAQEAGSIAGVVTDKLTRTPLAGAHVTVAGTRFEAATGVDGRFTIADVPPGTYRLSVRLIGYPLQAVDSVTVTAGATATVDVQLQRQAVELEAQVVVGYGTQRRGDVTGAVASVTADQFVQAPARDAASLIAGKIAGLAVTTPSGNPRSGTEISLRGTTTIQGPTSPLVVVDGVPGSLETVAPQDIETMDVLKDGSAAAIYGSRASNGVILITSKRNPGGAPTFRYDSWANEQTLYRTPDFLTAADYRRLIVAQKAAAAPDTLEDFGYSTNWQSLVLRRPVSYMQNLTIIGGGANTNYTAALSAENDQGIFLRSDNRNLTGRINVGHSMFDGRLAADLNLLTRVEDAFTGPDYNYAWRQTLIRNPTDRVVDDSGLWQERGTYFYVNPLGLIREVNGGIQQRDLRLHGTVTLRPVDKLRLSLLTGTERWSSLSGSATTFRHINTTISRQNSTAGRSTRSTAERILELTGTYATSLGPHSITLLGGYGYQDFVDENFSVTNFNFPTDLFEYNRLQNGDALTAGQATMNSGKESYKTVGFFSRLNYDWDNRYLLMASVRYEGDSRFGAAHKWGVFPAVSAGWRISKEPFMSRARFVDDLKLRVGYGVTGIAPDDPYLSLRTYSYGNRMLYEGVWIQGLAPSRNPNPNLRWERKDEINVGVDFSALDFRLAGTLDVYRRDTRDLLYEYPVPVPPNLFGRMLANIGHMQNNGVEAQLTYEVIRRPGMRWQTSANWSTNSNKLVSLSSEAYQTDCFTPTSGHTGEPIQQYTHRVCVGGPIGNFYGYQSVDIDGTGAWIVLNKNGDRISIRDAKEDDRRVLGNGIPKHYVAWNNAIQWKAFDLSASIRGALDFQILNFQRMYYENPTILEYNMLKSALDSVYGKRLLNYDLSYVSYYIEDGSYLKLDNITVGYRLPPRVAAALKANAGRVYLSGRNLHTWTRYRGLDPEVSASGLSPGNDSRDKYPTTRTFSMGLSLTF
jgi:TonB-linked SusC/RagA family outer membrane protein